MGPDPPDRLSHRGLAAEAMRLLTEAGEVIEVECETVLFRAGDRSDGLYVVLGGTVEIGKNGQSPGEVLEEKELFGLLEAFTGEPRLFTAVARTEARILHVGTAALDQLLREHPDAAIALGHRANERLLRHQLRRFLPDVFDGLSEREARELEDRFRTLRLDRAERLFSQGDPGDAGYLLMSGRLGAFVEDASGERMVGEVVPGEWVGEMSLLTGDPRSATVVALRDSILQECGDSDFEALVDEHPRILHHLSGLLIRRLREANRGIVHSPPRMTLALVPLGGDVDLHAFSSLFARSLEEYGTVLRIDHRLVAERFGGSVPRVGAGLEAGLQDMRLLPWLEEQEALYDVVMYEAEPGADAWSNRCVRQADRVILVVDADADASIGPTERRVRDLLSGSRVPFHLVLLHPADREIPRNTRRWLDVRQVARHHHVRRGRASDIGRVARLATGRGVGLALSGGGARGCAHIGVLRALTEAGVPVDVVGGTSAGAALGAPWAAGAVLDQPWDGDPDWSFVLDGARREFVAKKPFGRFTLPVYSFMSPHRLDRIFRDHFQDLDIADMWLPFLCVASDLHTGEKVVFESGPIWKAVRASISLPGIVPPVVDGDRLLVDGGVLDNVPEGEVKAACGGPVIAVDVTSMDRIPLEYQYESMPSPFEVIRSRISPFRKSLRIPGLFEVLVRTATVSDASRRASVDEVADLVLRPPVSAFGLLEFGALDAIVEEAYTYTMARLSEWKGPIARPPERRPAERGPAAAASSSASAPSRNATIVEPDGGTPLPWDPDAESAAGPG